MNLSQQRRHFARMKGKSEVQLELEVNQASTSTSSYKRTLGKKICTLRKKKRGRNWLGLGNEIVRDHKWT